MTALELMLRAALAARTMDPEGVELVRHAQASADMLLFARACRTIAANPFVNTKPASLILRTMAEEYERGADVVEVPSAQAN